MHETFDEEEILFLYHCVKCRYGYELKIQVESDWVYGEISPWVSSLENFLEHRFGKEKANRFIAKLKIERKNDV